MGDVSLADAKTKYSDAESADTTAKQKEQAYTTTDPSGIVREVEGLRSSISSNVNRIAERVQAAVDSGEFNEGSNTKLEEFKAAMIAWEASMPELDGESL